MLVRGHDVQRVGMAFWPRRPWRSFLAYLLAPLHGLLDKANRAAYAVCHRIAERSFTFAGRPLPLCARCSGTYLGAVAGLIVIAAHGSAVRRGRLLADPSHARNFPAGLGS